MSHPIRERADSYHELVLQDWNGMSETEKLEFVQFLIDSRDEFKPASFVMIWILERAGIRVP